MAVRFPLRIAVMDDDYYALKGVASLLSRDLRTLVTSESNSAEDLLKTLRTARRKPDVTIIDAEYAATDVPLSKVIAKSKKLAPDGIVICWSQYGESEHVNQAIDAGADAVFVKKDVQLAIGTNVVRAFVEKRAYTPSVLAAVDIKNKEWIEHASRLDAWEIHPELSPRLKQVFWLCIVYGMSVRAAAEEMHVQPETVERYRMKIYDILEDGWLSEDWIKQVWQDVRGEDENLRNIDWAFHLITQPPSASDEEE